MIQDIDPGCFQNEYRPLLPDADDVALYFRDGSALVGEGEEICFPQVGDFTDADFCYLFSLEQKRFFLVLPKEGCSADVPISGAWRFVETKSHFRRGFPRALAFAGIVGYHLEQWYRGNQYCGACGRPTEHAETERALVCPSCGCTIYPGISPAVIVAVLHEGRLLMTKYAGRPYRNYALVAGFNEVGESIEQTVHREVREEVGLSVKHLRFYKSQPWPFTSSLLMGFFCELDGVGQEIRLDENELAEAGWFRPEEVPDDVEGVALTAEMMMVFKRGEVEQVTRPPLQEDRTGGTK